MLPCEAEEDSFCASWLGAAAPLPTLGAVALSRE